MKRISALVLAIMLVIGTVPLSVLPVSGASMIGAVNDETESGSYGRIFTGGKLPGLDASVASYGFEINSIEDAEKAFKYVRSNTIPKDGELKVFGLDDKTLKSMKAFCPSLGTGDEIRIVNNRSINVVLEQDWTTENFFASINDSQPCYVNIDLNGHTWRVTGENPTTLYDSYVKISGGTLIFDNVPYGPIGASKELTICDVIFRDCHCADYGLVRFRGYSGTFYMENVTFQNCDCGYWGACVYYDEDPTDLKEWQRPKITFKNCNFIGCHAAQGGGVIFIDESQCEVNFEGCMFNGDYSEKYCGGAIYANGDDCTYRFRNCVAYRCHAADAGGFIFVGGLHNDFIGDPDFDPLGDDPYTMDTRSTVCGCYALGSGGAIYVSNSTGYGHYCKISGFNFASNTAGSPSHTVKSIQSLDANEWGGALCLRGEYAEVEYCDFIDNYSHYYGGAIYLGDWHSSVRSCVFRGNWSDPTYGGQDIFNDASGNVIEKNTYYSDNENTICMYKSGTKTGNNWQKPQTSTIYIKGNGTQNDPFIIDSTRAMLDLAMTVSAGRTYEGQYLRVTRDINAACQPIGLYSNYPFKGIIDGGGHTVRVYISAEKDDIGLFGYISGGTVRNMRLEGNVVGSNHVGSFCGNADNATFEDCVSGVNVHCLNNSLGGIVGSATRNMRFLNCVNNGTVQGNGQYTGGILGALTFIDENTSNSVSFDNCKNNGDVKGWDRVGGIMGSDEVGEFTAKRCVNTGNVHAGGCWAGGIVGETMISPFIIMNCMNSGDISAGKEVAAGIVGYSDVQGGVKQILNCANYGNINAPKEQGGILTTVYEMPDAEAVNCYGEARLIDVISCYNDGDMPFNLNSGAIVAGAGLGNFTNCICSGKRTVKDGNATVYDDDNYNLSVVRQMNIYICDHRSETVGWTYWWMSPATGRAEIDFDSTEIPEYSGSGTESNPYVIGKTSDLRYLELQLSQGLKKNVDGKYFLLKKDISYAGTAIGSSLCRFGGIFDGGGHTVTVTINGANLTGLFGSIEGATIENLNVTGSITGTDHTAGIAGEAVYSTIRNCSNSATIVGTHYSAGIVGGVWETTVADCSNNGTISISGSNAGGIIGGIWGNATADRCCNNGSVSAGEVAAGGIVGAVWDNCTVINCVNTQNGAIRAGCCAGGIVGNLIDNGNYSPRIENCANLAKITVGSSVGGIAYCKNPKASVLNCFNGGTLTATDGVGCAAILCGGAGTYSHCYYANNAGYIDADTVSIAVEKKQCGSDLVNEINSYIEADTAMKSDRGWTLWALDAVSHLASPLGTLMAAKELDGSGSEEDPYLIKSAEELAGITSRLIEGFDSNTTHYLLTTDIPEYNGAPIGTRDEPFVGIFDGNGYKVTVSKMNGGENVGLFGYVKGTASGRVTVTDDGSIVIEKEVMNDVRIVRGSDALEGGIIKNLTVAVADEKEGDVTVPGEIRGNLGSTGAVVGSAEDAQIVNCSSDAAVKGTDEVGGIVGNALGSTMILNCYVSAAIEGTGKNVGGIAGKLNDASIVRNCIKLETVKGNRSVGGIVGAMNGKDCAVENSAHYGSVIGTGKSDPDNKSYALGGIVGKVSDGGRVFLCFVFGNVTADTDTTLAEKSCGIMIGEKAEDTVCGELHFYSTAVELDWYDRKNEKWIVAGNDGKVTATGYMESNCKRKLTGNVNKVVPKYEGFTMWTQAAVVGQKACPGNFVQVGHRGVSTSASVFTGNAPVVLTGCVLTAAAGSVLAVEGAKKKRKNAKDALTNTVAK